MDQITSVEFSPYRVFSREEWAHLRNDTPLTLTESDIQRLRSTADRVSLAEVEDIYLPLSRLLSFYVEADQALYRKTRIFFRGAEEKKPFIIGLAGSVAAGKSTTARLLQALLAQWPATPKVDLVTTDGFLLPNAVLEREGLMERKGFPESYDLPTLLTFLSDIKAGRRFVRAPVYSHFYYDVLAGQSMVIDQPDILILEGLNVLQTGRAAKDGRVTPMVSDFFDFKIYLDAEEPILEHWYVRRFMRLRETAFRDPASYFHKYARLNDTEADAMARGIWRRINLPNLRDNIIPTRERADLILRKAQNHAIEQVALRKL